MPQEDLLESMGGVVAACEGACQVCLEESVGVVTGDWAGQPDVRVGERTEVEYVGGGGGGIEGSRNDVI